MEASEFEQAEKQAASIFFEQRAAIFFVRSLLTYLLAAPGCSYSIVKCKKYTL